MRKSDKAVLAVLGVVLGAMLAWGVNEAVHDHGDRERARAVADSTAVAKADSAAVRAVRQKCYDAADSLAALEACSAEVAR